MEIISGSQGVYHLNLHGRCVVPVLAVVAGGSLFRCGHRRKACAVLHVVAASLFGKKPKRLHGRLIVRDKDIRIRQQLLHELPRNVAAVDGQPRFRLFFTISGQLQHQLWVHHPQMQNRCLLKDLQVQGLKGHFFDAAAITGDTALSILFYLNHTEGGSRLVRLQNLQPRKALGRQIRADLPSCLVISHNRNQCRPAAQLLMGRCRRTGHAPEAHRKRACPDPLIALRRSIHQHNHILGAGADKKSVVFHCSFLLCLSKFFS